MNEPFGQLIATLHKAQATMASQLERLGASRAPDKVRVPRLQSEARQLGRATAALVARMIHKEASPDLIVQAKVLVALFEAAERRAALLSWRRCQAEAETAGELDDEDTDEMDGRPEGDAPLPAAAGARERTRPVTGPKARDRRIAHQLAGLGLSGTRSAQAKTQRKQRLPA